MLILVMNICSVSVTHAEIKDYIGEGEYIMSEFETLNDAKQRAKEKAERNAQEQAGVFVESYTEVINHKLKEDDIITMTSGILKIVDVQYDLTPLEDGKSVLINAKVQATIDSSDVDKWLEKGFKQRSHLIEQNETLMRVNAEQDRQIAELKQLIEDIKIQQDEENIIRNPDVEAKIAVATRKIVTDVTSCDLGVVYRNADDCKLAVNDYSHTIAIYPEYIYSYLNRGVAYFALGYYERAIDDYNKAIKLDRKYALAYNNRGDAYYNLGNLSQAIADYNKAVKFDPNLAQAYFGRGTCYKELNEFSKAEADFAKAESLGFVK